MASRLRPAVHDDNEYTPPLTRGVAQQSAFFAVIILLWSNLFFNKFTLLQLNSQYDFSVVDNPNLLV